MPFLDRQRWIFFCFLLSVAMIHAGFMVFQFQQAPNWPAVTENQQIKIKLLQEAAKDVLSKRQIVQSEDSENNEKSDEAYLSDKDRKFERQTMARTVDSFKDAALGNAQINAAANNKKSFSPSVTSSIKNLKLSDIGIEAANMQKSLHERSPASNASKGRENGNPLSTGLSATNDYVEDINLGDFTQLNTVEYKFYGFFHRIRQKLEQFWGKSIQEKAHALFRQGRRLPARENLITSLQITLNEKGEIIAVKIMGTSGVKELDDAAIESFNQAGPFPNPPKDLLVNGKAIIEWGFVVKS
jgi:TonB family protein